MDEADEKKHLGLYVTAEQLTKAKRILRRSEEVARNRVNSEPDEERREAITKRLNVISNASAVLDNVKTQLSDVLNDGVKAFEEPKVAQFTSHRPMWVVPTPRFILTPNTFVVKALLLAGAGKDLLRAKFGKIAGVGFSPAPMNFDHAFGLLYHDVFAVRMKAVLEGVLGHTIDPNDIVTSVLSKDEPTTIRDLFLNEDETGKWFYQKLRDTVTTRGTAVANA